MERCDGGDLISPQQDLGSTVGFSQQHGTKSSVSCALCLSFMPAVA